MNKKTIMLISLVLVMMLGFSLPAVYADDHGKMKEYHRKGMKEKVFSKAHFILTNKEELGLSDAQVEKIKDLIMRIKKDLIRTDAEIEILGLEIKAAMWADPIDTKAVGKLIDAKYEFKKQKAKSLVEAYVALKNILTKEQKEKMKELRKGWKKGVMQHPKMEGKIKCPVMGEKK